MSKHTIYRCDACNKVLSDESTGIDLAHLSLAVGHPTGWYSRKGAAGWRADSRINSGIYQFCDEHCLTVYFSACRGEPEAK